MKLESNYYLSSFLDIKMESKKINYLSYKVHNKIVCALPIYGARPLTEILRAKFFREARVINKLYPFWKE